MLRKEITLLLWIISAIFLQFCTTTKEELLDEEAIYLPNRQWVFTVKRSDNATIDSLYLTVLNERFEGDSTKWKLRWIAIVRDSNRVLIDTSISRVIDREGSPFISFSTPSIKGKGYQMTRLLPEPQVRFPIVLGHEMKVKDTIVVNRDSPEFEGLVITGTLKVSGKTFYKNPIVKDTCWIIDAFGNSEKGSFKAQYYFHKKFGFVYFYYDFVAYQVEISLAGLKFL